MIKLVVDNDLNGETLVDTKECFRVVIFYKVELDIRNLSSSKSYTVTIVINR